MKRMEPSQRTKILVEGDSKLLSQLAEQIIERYPVKIVQKAKKSLAMTKARDSVALQPFYIGEVLLTECIVSIGEVYGFGAVMGDKRQQAYELSVVDAAYRACLPESEAWRALLEKEEERIESRHQEELSLSMRTKVNFNMMGESVDKR